ncbi:macro domain-containing protein [Ruegeria arenilitoris]|uniref:macro domain-containing protein n=1 Tax=Ruegeria arenilitoris TaxID=1173585 RepID=UPI0014798A36|nr:macro domain-containing protein [Ruegeria arenilitoris]
MKTVKGDLIQLATDGEFDVIVHGCNCFHTMGAGIAKTIAARFPAALEADKRTEYGVRTKLGTISIASVRVDAVNFTIVNAYTQFDWRGRGLKADYNAISSCFDDVAQRFPAARIGYPLIGAGLARGDWGEIEPRIQKALEGLDHTLVVYSG